MSAWCGLVAGLLEVGTIVVRKQVFDPDHLYKMSRHFVWLIPLSNLCVFLTLGLIGCGVVAGLAAPRSVAVHARLVARLRSYPPSWLPFRGSTVWPGWSWRSGWPRGLFRSSSGRSRGFRRFVLVSFPAAVAIVAILGASLWVGDRWKQARENARSLPPPGSPNVLLIVMDTVAAGHLSLHGYDRATSTTLVELAGRGTRFDSARAASSWTLPSHATMFTGRWLHELSVGWFTPLDQKHPTLAEFLGDRGYATAGFVANTYYCGTDSGLARGFTRYQDFIFPELTALKTAALVSRALDGVRATVYFSEDWLESAGLLPSVRPSRAVVGRRSQGGGGGQSRAARLALAPRAAGAAVFRFLELLSMLIIPMNCRREGFIVSGPSRPTLSTFPDPSSGGCSTRRRSRPPAWHLPPPLMTIVSRTSMSSSASWSTSWTGAGFWSRTWLIITSDHGESFGEHPGIFCHGMSLYDTELHVPLLIIPPGGSESGRVVKEAVCLRDLAATIVDVAGQEAGSPFPGASLARFWQASRARSHRPGPHRLHRRLPRWSRTTRRSAITGAALQQLSPLAAVKDAEWSYIRREGDGREKLFHLSEDPNEQHDLAGDPSARTTLEQMRAALDRLTGGPLLPERFSR